MFFDQGVQLGSPPNTVSIHCMALQIRGWPRLAGQSGIHTAPWRQGMNSVIFAGGKVRDSDQDTKLLKMVIFNGLNNGTLISAIYNYRPCA
jgi:hypothetical protein